MEILKIVVNVCLSLFWCIRPVFVSPLPRMDNESMDIINNLKPGGQVGFGGNLAAMSHDINLLCLWMAA